MLALSTARKRAASWRKEFVTNTTNVTFSKQNRTGSRPSSSSPSTARLCCLGSERPALPLPRRPFGTRRPGRRAGPRGLYSGLKRGRPITSIHRSLSVTGTFKTAHIPQEPAHLFLPLTVQVQYLIRQISPTYILNDADLCVNSSIEFLQHLL